MTLRTWLSATFLSVIALATSSGLADSRAAMERAQPAQTRMEMTRIAQSRAGSMNKAAPAPAPGRAKAEKLEPKPADSARSNASAALRTGRTSRR